MSRFMNRSPAQGGAGPGSVNSGDSGIGSDQPKQSSSFTRHFRTSSQTSSTAPSGIFGRSPVSPSFPTNAQQFNPVAFPSANAMQTSPGLPGLSLIPPRDQALSLDSHRRAEMPSFFHLPGKRNNKDRASPNSADFPPVINLNSGAMDPGPIGPASISMEKTRSKSPPPAEASATVKRFHTMSSDHPPARLQNRNQVQLLTSPELNDRSYASNDRSPKSGDSGLTLLHASSGGQQPPQIGRRLGPTGSLQNSSARQRYLGPGSAVEGQDTSAVDDMSEALEEYGDATATGMRGLEGIDGMVGGGVGQGLSAGLHRQSSLPNRGPISLNPVHAYSPSANNVSRKSSRSSRHPSISEDGRPNINNQHGLVSAYGSSLASPVIGAGSGLGSASSISGGVAGNGLSSQTSPIMTGGMGYQGEGDVSRSSSLRQMMGKVDNADGIVSPAGSEPIPHHHRSYSHSNTTSNPRPAPGAIGRASSPPEAGLLHKSNSLRATLSNGQPQHSGPSLAEAGAHLAHSHPIGHAHTQSMYSLSDPVGEPPLSANAALTPTSLAMWDTSALAPGQPQVGMERRAQLEADGVKRALSLNQGYGHNDRVRERSSKASSQASRREKDFKPMDPWQERTSVDDDGWAEFEQLRNGQTGNAMDLNLSPPLTGTLSHGDTEPQEGAYQIRLRQAFDAMQLGTQMMQSNPETGRRLSALGSTNFGAFEAPALGLPNTSSGNALAGRPSFGATMQNGMTAEHSAIAYNNLLQQQVAQQQEQLQQQQQMLLAASGMLQQYSPATYGGGSMQLGGSAIGPQSTFMTAGAAGILPSTLWSMNPQQPSLTLGGGPNIPQMQAPSQGFGSPSYQGYPPTHQNGNNRYNGQHQQSHRNNHGAPGLSLPTSAQRAAASAPRPDYRPEVARAADKEVRELVASRGLNPIDFNCAPPRARFFVIKSFTEDDVQKSLKHEIWSSTTFGNKRLDSAFQESTGSVYLFFSVNGSGHFCGVAEMLTRVDYNKSADVWAQDGKWKGVFTLKWIFVKDIPNGVLRHIRLTNTTEQKPITNSRDTQELTYEAGVEVLRIFLGYRQKTSLLEDFGFYEMQSANKAVSPSVTGNVTPSTAPTVVDPASASAQSPADGQGTATLPGSGVPSAMPSVPIGNAPGGVQGVPVRGQSPAQASTYSSAVNAASGQIGTLPGPATATAPFAASGQGQTQGQGPPGPVIVGPGPPPATMTGGFGKPPGFSKGFNASGPPSLTPGGRFAVMGGSKNGVSGGVRGNYGR